MRKTGMTCGILVLMLHLSPDLHGQDASKDPWARFRYFEGSWEGHETGIAGIGRGDRTYAFIMNGKYLLLKNRSEFAPQEKNPKGEVHEDWTIFSYDTRQSRLAARQFNVEGYVNQLALEQGPASGNRFVFVGECIENLPPGYRVRLTYEVTGEDDFDETFELAAPGKDFSTLLKNRWKRRTQSLPADSRTTNP